MNAGRSCLRLTLALSVTLGVAAGAAGCGGEADRSGAASEVSDAPAPDPTRPLPAEVRAPLEDGNEAARAGDFQAALDAYRAALAVDSTVGAAWLGVAWAQEELGQPEAARQARVRLRALAAPPRGGPHHRGPEEPSPYQPTRPDGPPASPGGAR